MYNGNSKERARLFFDTLVGNKMAAILPPVRGNKMRRLVFCPEGYIPQKGQFSLAAIRPAFKRFGETVMYKWGEEWLHIYGCQLDNEASILEEMDFKHRSPEATQPSLALALERAKEMSGKEIPVAGQLKVGQEVRLVVNGRTDTWTGLPSFLPEYMNFGDPLIEGKNSMRIFHAKGRPPLASGQEWKCKVVSINPGTRRNVKGHMIIHIGVRVLNLA